MAIAKVNKVEIIGLKEDKDKILALLQKLGIVELINIKEVEAVSTPQIISGDLSLIEIEETISYLAGFKEKPGVLQGMVGLKPIVYEQQLKEVIADFNYQEFLLELSKLRNHLKTLAGHRDHLIQERQLLLPWRKLSIALDQIHYTKSCGILLGVLRTDDYENLIEDCKNENINLFCEVVNQDKTNTYLIIFYIKEDFEKLETILKNYHFNFITFLSRTPALPSGRDQPMAETRHKNTVDERLLEINREVMILDEQIQDTKNKITHLAQQQFNLKIIYDYLSNIKNRQEVDKNLTSQQFTFCLSGWIRNKDTQIFKKLISENFKDLAIFISEPKPEEGIPVILENNRLIQPFEFITKIYGMPKYNELDPTPFLAPFFFIYFGFCVSDVGYGFILALFSWAVLKKCSRPSGIPPPATTGSRYCREKAGKMGPQGVRFFRLFFFCGISTIIVGALTGSWFGNLFDLLAESNKLFLPLQRFKDRLILLDPMKEPTKLLGIALSFGIIQVWFGNIVAAIGNIKNRRYIDVLLDQVSMLTFLFGMTGFGLVFLQLIDARGMDLFKYAMMIGAFSLILTQGRSEKGIGSKLFYGAYNLYNAFSGYLSDILSYSRLWALGLVTGVMASTINLISVQFSQIVVSIIPFLSNIPFIKILVSSVVLVSIFVFGHLVSFLMNLLGAFVHPVRLQFVEFFSKFFKSGGKTFKPFKIETKYINLS